MDNYTLNLSPWPGLSPWLHVILQGTSEPHKL